MRIFMFTHNNTCADSEPEWGGIDKPSLPRAAYADQGETGKKSTWKYPHHWVKNGGDKNENGCFTSGTMYLHQGGLNAAWSAANGGRSGEEAPQAVKDHLQAHRKALGIEDRSRYGIKAKAGASKEAEIWIYEEIGDGWYGGISAAQFVKDLKELGDLDKITLRINSPGGNVFDGIAIYNVLKQHKAKVVTYIDGYAASIASVVAMAGDEIYMAENGIMMIHNAWALAIGNAADIRKVAAELDKVDEAILSTYMKRVKKEKETICQMMADETWMSAAECLEMGFIDEITGALEAAACFDLRRFKYRNAPKPADQAAADQERRNRLARLDMACRQMKHKAASGRK